MDNYRSVNLEILTKNSNHLKIKLSGRLDLKTIPSIWNRCLDLQATYHPQKLMIDAQDVTYCDGTGIALLETLRKNQIQKGQSFEIHHLNAHIQQLFDLVSETTTLTPLLEEETIETTQELITQTGKYTEKFLYDLHLNIAFLGRLFTQLIHTIFHPSMLRWKDTIIIMEQVGPRALPIIALIGFLIGLISTFQAAPSFKEFGVQIYLIDLVSLGLFREMGPLMTAVLLAGRTASSFAAEIGTMKINQEIDALTTMGLQPIQFLVMPRIIATTFFTPLLNIFFIAFGLIGSALIMSTLGYTLSAFWNEFYNTISINDIVGGLVKVFFFGFVIASVGCFHGLTTQRNARSVGQSTTQAVVNSLILIVIVDGIFASIYYVLGI